VVGADRPEAQLAQDGPGSAIEDGDLIGCGLDDRDALAFQCMKMPIVRLR
jgi:hypothetical protein